MDSTLPKAELGRFIALVDDKGIINPNTAAGWKATFASILEDVGDAEDLRGLDVKMAIRRFNNKNPGKLGPSSLAEYERRLKTMIQEALKYARDPAAYKGLGRHPTAAKRTEKKKNGKPAEPANDLQGSVALTIKLPPSSSLALEFPMRPDFLAQVVIPRDMTTDEARRFVFFILSLAQDFRPPEAIPG